MSSRNQFNKMTPGNVKIKTEPGTNRLGNIMASSSSMANNMNIKIEPGTVFPQRLSSLKLPRDLKLGGSKTKVFKPNLNVVRNKQANSSSSNQSNRGRGRGRGRGFDRGRGSTRGRISGTIQSEGIFSEGIAESMPKRSHEPRENFAYDVTKVMDKPTIKKTDWKIDKHQEDLIMKELLSIHIEPDDLDVKQDQHPVILPINKCDETEISIKFEQIIKSEIKPLENGTSSKTIFENSDKLLFFQFPDSLPGIGAVSEPCKDTDPRNPGKSTNSDKNADEEKSQVENKCTLRDINEGILGKIVIYKSGKTKLVIGNTRFDVQIGPNAGFLQNVMSVPVNTETKTGDMINLGSLDGNVIITPEWDTLLLKNDEK